jgi:hypothetical protein
MSYSQIWITCRVIFWMKHWPLSPTNTVFSALNSKPQCGQRSDYAISWMTWTVQFPPHFPVIQQVALCQSYLSCPLQWLHCLNSYCPSLQSHIHTWTYKYWRCACIYTHVCKTRTHALLVYLPRRKCGMMKMTMYHF